MIVANNFWDWFVRHEAELFDLDPHLETEREILFNQVASELRKVNPDLTFEFGPSAPRREFVISAGGMKRAFPAVISLANAAPHFDRWRITAFRPRRPVQNVVQVLDKRVDPKDVQFMLLDNGKMAGIYLFIPGFQEEDTNFKQIGYLLLDETLGEYDVESKLGLIKMLPTQTPAKGERYPLAELPRLFDQLVAKLDGNSGRLS